MAGIFRSASLKRDVERFLRSEAKHLARFPLCCRCGEPAVQETVFHAWDGGVICDDCLVEADDGLGFREPIE